MPLETTCFHNMESLDCDKTTAVLASFGFLRIMAFCSHLLQLLHDSFSFELIMQPIRHGGFMDWLIVNAFSHMKISPKTHKARHLSCLKRRRRRTNKEEEALRGKKKQPEKLKLWTKKKEEHASQMSITIIRPAVHREKQSTKRK